MTTMPMTSRGRSQCLESWPLQVQKPPIPGCRIFNRQLDKLLPNNGFKLLDARSERIVDGESITCNLGTATP